MMKEFNSYNLAKPYSMYKTIYRTLYSHVACLNYDIEYNSPYYITMSATRLYNYTFSFEGYIECLYDLRLVNDIEFNNFYEFTKAIREECIDIFNEKVRK